MSSFIEGLIESAQEAREERSIERARRLRELEERKAREIEERDAILRPHLDAIFGEKVPWGIHSSGGIPFTELTVEGFVWGVYYLLDDPEPEFLLAVKVMRRTVMGKHEDTVLVAVAHDLDRGSRLTWGKRIETALDLGEYLLDRREQAEAEVLEEAAEEAEAPKDRSTGG